MPCRGPDCDPSDEYGEQLRKQKKELDKVTRLLCEVLTKVEAYGKKTFDAVASNECSDWWKQHQEADKKRIAAEEKAKLAEKRALLDKAEKLKKELAAITKQLDKHKE